MKTKDSGVSPVIAVMLMLVVTIIIAAVVSGFAGSLIGNAEKAPSISMEVNIKNAGSFANSHFEGKVLGVSEAIRTSDLNLVTTWAKDGSTHVTKVLPGDNVTKWEWKTGNVASGAPWGYGPGTKSMNSGVPNDLTQKFGNYTLLGGSVMYALPAGQNGGFIVPDKPASTGYGVETAFTYKGYDSSSAVDGMQTVLGEGWEALRTGDSVNVKLIHVPSGSTILDKTVVVS